MVKITLTLGKKKGWSRTLKNYYIQRTKTISYVIKTQIHLKYAWHWHLVSVSSLQLEPWHLHIFLWGVLLRGYLLLIETCLLTSIILSILLPFLWIHCFNNALAFHCSLHCGVQAWLALKQGTFVEFQNLFIRTSHIAKAIL